ncbi:MATE family efflux transporter [Paraclostridium sordellii]|uniref:Multidrug export protein MepA n=1 Tax=Paraclostridium sordellii TaxID=1505 RepID=A0A0C7I871_PARSO|nr:MATE family efflux transporter [Paeniclostridium sordellii]CEN78871.1 Na driven multidrug efflux pump [[Clostridium] sordellii] [Paeniclostridium sordellii]CEO09974.1 Na driven multidrug efflux pump [[Clostridium] sordellii] [Paeniclostridium sordellii]CEP87689.1 Na driven multidrug efflux pump [[Clostridium] sordellii] [Paeniclostridium sordellii]CEP98631.1 Na driven multidrug efflux pump [[Clostridium] sordellii] [Paeniclostridium sordellii]CEQ03967.1 Na driven multidrug efflux pump [[Clo
MENMKDLKTQFKQYVIPSVASMWVFSLYSMVDGAFVSRGVGSEALAAVNISTPYINTLFALSVLLSTGASTIVSMTLGKGDNKKASEYFTLNTVLLAIISIFITVISLLNLENIAIFLGATESTLPLVKGYLGNIILFVGFYLVSYGLELLIKCDGYPHLSTIGVIIAAITNIVLDYIFVIQFKWGVEGAALATGIARILSVSFFISHFLRKRGKLRFCKFKFDFNFIKRIVFIGIPDSMTEASLAVVILLFNQSILRLIGESALVSYSVICYITTLVLTTMLGISQGLQPICSYYYGKEDDKSVLKLLDMSISYIKKSSIIAFLLVIIFANQIVAMFIDKSDMNLFLYTVKTLRISSVAYLIMGYNVIISGFCVATGKAIHASIVSLGRGLVVITLSLIIMTFIFGGSGIWMATFVSEAIVLAISSIILRNNKLRIKNNIKSDIYMNIEEKVLD